MFSYVRSHAALRRLADPLRRTLRARKPAAGVVGAFDHLDRAAITFLYGTVPQKDHYSRRAREVLDEASVVLPPDRRERFELRMLQWGLLYRFDILPPEDKEDVLNVILNLVDEAFEDVGSGSAPGRLAARPRAVCRRAAAQEGSRGRSAERPLERRWPSNRSSSILGGVPIASPQELAIGRMENLWRRPSRRLSRSSGRRAS